MEQHTRGEGRILLVLSVMLVSVFALSVLVYDDLAASADHGVLAVFAEDVRDFLQENEAVAVFFGIEEPLAEEPDTASVDTAAEAYILRYNAIYADLP